MKKHKCPLCAFEVLGLTDLSIHITRSHDKFRCVYKDCKKKFMTRGGLNKHKLIHYVKRQKFKCAKCPRTFAFKSQLQQHFPVHSDAKPFVCTQQDCLAAFKTKAECKRHVKKGHNNVRYQCPQCSTRCTSEKNLSDHLRTRHVGIKCEFCSRTFYHRQSLSNHRKICTKKPGKEGKEEGKGNKED